MLTWIWVITAILLCWFAADVILVLRRARAAGVSKSIFNQLTINLAVALISITLVICVSTVFYVRHELNDTIYSLVLFTSVPLIVSHRESVKSFLDQ